MCNLKLLSPPIRFKAQTKTSSLNSEQINGLERCFVFKFTESSSDIFSRVLLMSLFVSNIVVKFAIFRVL